MAKFETIPKIPINCLEPLHVLAVLNNQPEFLKAGSNPYPSTKIRQDLSKILTTLNQE